GDHPQWLLQVMARHKRKPLQIVIGADERLVGNAKLLRVLLQRILGLPPRGDVPEHQNRALDSSALATYGRATVVDRSPGSIARNQHCVIGESNNLPFPQYLRHGTLYLFASVFVDDPKYLIQMLTAEIRL